MDDSGDDDKESETQLTAIDKENKVEVENAPAASAKQKTSKASSSVGRAKKKAKVSK